MGSFGSDILKFGSGSNRIFGYSDHRIILLSPSPDANFSGNYQNGQRGYSSPSLGRSSGFREGSESRNASSAKVNSRSSAISSGDVLSLSQCLMLEPIVVDDPRYARPGELRRVLANSVGSNSVENSSVVAHPKTSPPVASEDLKRFISNFADGSVKASCRAKKWGEHITKLNKYVDALPSKKPQRQQNELLANERSSGLGTLKISQMHRNSSELGCLKFDDRSKSVGLSKRSHTSTSEHRTECRNNAVLREPMAVTKERDIDSNVDSDMVEEKIRRLPAGGEGWDKKIKRKRSVGAVSFRSTDNDGELKQNMHNKLSFDSVLLPRDSSHNFRFGASGSGNKLDPMPSPTSSTAHVPLKIEQEKLMISMDVSGGPIKERPLGKVKFMLNNSKDNHTLTPSSIVKGKASRVPRRRSGSMVAANVPRVPETLGSWEQGQSVNKDTSVSGPDNQKRPLPSGSSFPPTTQWGDQRPQKMSRTRRTNNIPVSNNDELKMQSEGCSPTDFGSRINTSILSKSAANGSQNIPASGSVSFRSNKCRNSSDSMDSFVHSCSDAEKRSGISNPLYRRVLSALITKKDEVEEFEETGFGLSRNKIHNSHVLSETESKRMDDSNFCEPEIGAQTRKNSIAHKFFPCNGNMDVDRSPGTLDYLCNDELTQKDGGFVHTEVEVVVRLSRFDNAPESLLANNGGISTFDLQYEQMGAEEKLVIELQSIGLFLEPMPALDDNEEEGNDHLFARKDKKLLEQARKKTLLDPIDRALQEGNAIGRCPEKVALDKLVELADKKLLTSEGGYASKHEIAKVPTPVALASLERVLDKFHEVEDSGISCFSEPSLREIIYAPPRQFTEMELLPGVNVPAANDAFETPNRPSGRGVAKNGPVSNRGKKKELSIDDVGGSAFGMLASARGKRSKRDSSKNGRLLMGDSKGERKAKPKKQKTNQLSMSGVDKFTEPGSEPTNNRRKYVRFTSSPSKQSKVPLDNIDGIELGVDSGTCDPHDLNSWFDGLQDDHDDVIGLDIPMDDLSSLNMF